MRVHPFINYFGGKHATSGAYPRPVLDTIIEPFAGGAGYACRYPYRKVILIEKNPQLAAVWRYLIGASGRDILSLPIVRPGESLDDYSWPCQEARDLAGFCINIAIAAPCTRLSANWGAQVFARGDASVWGAQRRSRIAAGIARIRHWTVIEGDYTDAPDTPATWFIDPPYDVMGIHYKHGANAIDFQALGEWCQSRQGQVIVCEQVGASWLPFVPFHASRSAARGNDAVSEAIWYRPPERGDIMPAYAGAGGA